MAEKEENSPQSPDENEKSSGELSEEQADALDKIMAELEGRTEEDSEATPNNNQDDNPDDRAADASGSQADETNGLTDEQEEALKKIMAEIEGATDSDGSSEPETSITAEQEEALDKIVAELQGDSESKISDAVGEESPPEAVPSDASEANGLSPEQEASLQKIMAEIEGKTAEETDSADTDTEALSPSETESDQPDSASEEKPPTQDTSESSPSTDGGFEELDMSDFETELAKVVSEANSQSGAAPKPKRRSKVETSLPKDAPQKPTVDDEKPTIETKVGDSPSAGKQEDTKPDEIAKDEPDDKAEATDKQEAVDEAPSLSETYESNREKPSSADSENNIAPLPEASSEATGTRRKKPFTKKIWRYVGYGSGTLLLIVAAVLIYPLFMKPQSAPVTQSVVVEEEQAPPTPPVPAPQSSPQQEQTSGLTQAQNNTLTDISEKISIIRIFLLDKLNEINDLKLYYQQGINETEDNLVDLIRKEKLTRLDDALKDQRMELGLKTIQRRKSYISRLTLPSDQVLQASEELLYLERKANIFREMMQNTSGISLDPFDKQVSQSIERINKIKDSLTIDQVSPPADSLDSIWNELQAKLKNSNDIKLNSSELAKQNHAIWQEICSGKFDRKYALTELTPKVAQCLLQWDGMDLYLNQLKTLPPEVAQILSHWPGKWLGLNGLESLSPEAAKHLARWKGERLSLNGLTELSPKATLYLSRWQGKQLELVGLKHIGQWENPKIELFVSDKLKNQIPK